MTVIVSAVVATSLRAQIDIPAFNTYGATDSSLIVDAGMAFQHVNDVGDSLFSHRSFAAVDFHMRDSVHRMMRDEARVWLRQLPTKEKTGNQTEPFIQLLVAADEDSVAEQRLAKRLETPGLSLEDRAYALYTGVVAFADPLVPQRFAVAERYLKSLNALGPKVAQRRYQAEVAMVRGYDDAGQTAEVARHGIAAVHLVPLLSLKDLEQLHWAWIDSPYPIIASAVAIQPNGAATIKEMNAILTASTATAPDSVALDSSFLRNSRWQTEHNVELLQAVARLGTTPGPILSNRWLNRPDTARSDLAVNDGTIRVLQTADDGCPICILSAMHLQVLADRDSLIHPVLLTWTDASRGNRIISPDSSAKLLTHMWLEHLHIRYPIALWIAYARDTLSDGSVVESLRDDSATICYPETSKPSFYILDGQGRIRADFFGGGPTVERQIVEAIHRLAAEQRQHAGLDDHLMPAAGGQ